MKYSFLLPLVLLITPACTTLDTIRQVATVATQPTPLGSFTVLDNKARFAAEALYNVPADAYRSANERGLLSPKLKADLKGKLQTAAKALILCRNAYKLGDLKSFNERYKALFALRDEAMKLIPKG